MSKARVLVVGSNATRIEVQGGTGPTGQYLNETVVPVMALVDAGYNIVLATPNGSKPHIDEASATPLHFGGNEAAFRRAEQFYADHPSMNPAHTLQSVIDGGLGSYAAIFVPGGQAPVVDLMQDPELGEILRYFHAEQRPTAMLCHGPIATVAAMPKSREFRAALVAGDDAKAAELAKGWQYAGYKMTIFSNTEEVWVKRDILQAKMYFYVVDALKTAGGNVITGPDFEPQVIEDRELITGQNPRSDHMIAEALIHALQRTAVAA
jgi:putative intracellular protease/amidase